MDARHRGARGSGRGACLPARGGADAPGKAGAGRSRGIRIGVRHGSRDEHQRTAGGPGNGGGSGQGRAGAGPGEYRRLDARCERSHKGKGLIRRGDPRHREPEGSRHNRDHLDDADEAQLPSGRRVRRAERAPRGGGRDADSDAGIRQGPSVTRPVPRAAQACVRIPQGQGQRDPRGPQRVQVLLGGPYRRGAQGERDPGGYGGRWKPPAAPPAGAG